MPDYGLCCCGCGGKTTLAKQSDTRLGYVKGEPVRYVIGHNGRRSPVEYIEEDRGHVTPCWVWQLALAPNGYGRSGKRWAYKVVYERLVGAVPEGLHLDHLCRVRSCVNPGHLEPVTPSENRRRGGQERLTAADVRRIRDMVANGATQSLVAGRFGIHQSHVSRIVRHARGVWASA